MSSRRCLGLLGTGRERAPASEPPAVPAVVAVAAHDELVVETGGHRWRVRHVPKGPTPGSLRVNLMVGSGERFHVDTVDLYAARQRAGFAEAAAAELRCPAEQLREELGRVLLATEDAQAAAAEAKPAGGAPAMSAAEREAALELLCSADLLERVTDAFGALGVVGERPARPGRLAHAHEQAVGPALGGRRAVVVGRRQVDPGRRRPVAGAARGQGGLLGHDRPGPLLPGRHRPGPQGARHRRGGRSVAGQLPAQAARVRRAPFDRGRGQGPGHAAAWSPTPMRWPAPWRCS